MSIISNENRQRPIDDGAYRLKGDQVFDRNGYEVPRAELDPRKLAEARFHAACAARIAAREALDAAELEYGRAGRALADAEARAAERKREQHAAAYRELMRLGHFEALDAERGVGGVTAIGFRRLIQEALVRVAEAGR